MNNPVGQFNCVAGPVIFRTGGMFPRAVRLYTLMDGGRKRPDPGMRLKRVTAASSGFSPSRTWRGVK